jgi:hypothetical protein
MVSMMAKDRRQYGWRAGFGEEGEESGGSHTPPPAPDLTASQEAPTWEGAVGMISEMLVGREVISCAYTQKTSS